MVATSAGLTVVRDYITQHGGAGFMRNVRGVPGATCLRCHGWVSPPYDTCYPCNMVYRGAGADQLGFLTYAWPGTQAGKVMRSYKATSPVPTAVQNVTMILAYGVVAHQDCYTHPSHGPFTSWATVPSLPAKAGTHQLNAIAQQFLSEIPMVSIRGANPLAGKPRGFEPDNFVVESASGHVLLLDDTWASGGHVESAAAALKAAGATFVSTLVVARWLEPNYGGTQAFITTHLTSDYDPDICPLTGKHC